MSIDGAAGYMVQYMHLDGKESAMPKSDALRRAQAKYDARLKQVKIRLDPATDQDIIQKLDSVGNIVQYLKYLIRKDMKSGSN